MLNEERSLTSYFQINIKESSVVVGKHHFKLPNIKTQLRSQYCTPIEVVAKNKINCGFKIN